MNGNQGPLRRTGARRQIFIESLSDSTRLLYVVRANLKLKNRMDAERIPGHRVAGAPIIDFLIGFLTYTGSLPSIIETMYARHAR